MTAHGLARAKSCAPLLQGMNEATILLSIPVACSIRTLRVFGRHEFIESEGAGK
jgi:hypothetical protein